MTTMIETWVQLRCQEQATADAVAALAGWLYAHTEGARESDFSTLVPCAVVLVEAASPEEAVSAVREAVADCPPEFKVYESMEVL